MAAQQESADAKRVALELRAGKAVAAGALLAGPLAKRSEWLHTWNRRFCVLTTEELAWHKDTGSSGADGVAASGESRAVRIHSTMRIVAKDGVLLLQPGKEPASSLWFSAASEPELRVWHKMLRSLIDNLDSTARIARLHVHENSSRFAPAPFAELPHIGSRNLREGKLTKLYFTCHGEARALSGSPPLSQPSRMNPAGFETQQQQRRLSGGGGGGAGAGAAGEAIGGGKRDVLLYLIALPPKASEWHGVRRRAFRELLEAIASADCPRLMPSLFVDILPDVSKAAVYRELQPRGSLRDLIHGSLPLQPHGIKHGRAQPDSSGNSSSGGGGGGGGLSRMSSFTSTSSSLFSYPLAPEAPAGAPPPSTPTRTSTASSSSSFSPFGSSASLTRDKSQPTSPTRDQGGQGSRKRGPQPVPPHLISHIGRSILEGLAALRCLGLPYPHLHAGNVIIEPKTDGSFACRLSEYEMAILGVTHASSKLARPRGPSAGLVADEVICFGQVRICMHACNHTLAHPLLFSAPCALCALTHPTTLSPFLPLVTGLIRDVDRPRADYSRVRQPCYQPLCT